MAYRPVEITLYSDAAPRRSIQSKKRNRTASTLKFYCIKWKINSLVIFT